VVAWTGFAGSSCVADDLRTVMIATGDRAANPALRRAQGRLAVASTTEGVLPARVLDLIQSDEPADLRRAAALAVGYSADPANDTRLTQMLESDNTRRPAAFAIALGGGEEAVRALLGVLRRETPR
jgi:HEAT repeat protein